MVRLSDAATPAASSRVVAASARTAGVDATNAHCGKRSCGIALNSRSASSATRNASGEKIRNGRRNMAERIMIEWRDRVDGSFAWCGHYRLDIAPNGSEFDASVVEVSGEQTLPRLNSPNLPSLDVAKTEAARLARLIINADIKQLEELRSRLPCEPLTMAPAPLCAFV